MNSLPDFIAQNWLLSLAFILTLAVVIFSETRARQRSASRLTAQQTVMLMNRENTTVVDIRDRPAFESGHILGAVHIPMSQVLSDPEKALKKYQGKHFIIVCANGMQSANVGKQLRKKGFVQVNFLAGGMQGWMTDNFPVTKD